MITDFASYAATLTPPPSGDSATSVMIGGGENEWAWQAVNESPALPGPD
jgi:hypothetical protein